MPSGWSAARQMGVAKQQAVHFFTRWLFNLILTVKARKKIEPITERCYGFAAVGPFITQTELDHYQLQMVMFARDFIPVGHHDPLGALATRAVFLGLTIPEAVAGAVRRYRKLIGGVLPHHDVVVHIEPEGRFSIDSAPEYLVASLFLMITDLEIMHTLRNPGMPAAMNRASLLTYDVRYNHTSCYFPELGVWEFDAVTTWEPDPAMAWKCRHVDTSNSDDSDSDDDQDDDDDDTIAIAHMEISETILFGPSPID
jgi:hypothetical protein